MNEFIDAEDMLDMLFDKKMDLTYLPADILLHIVSYMDSVPNLMTLHYVSRKFLSLMQNNLTWRKMCLVQGFAFLHDDEKDWKKHYFGSISVFKIINGISFSAIKIRRLLFGANDKWLSQLAFSDDGFDQCLESITPSDLAIPLEDPRLYGIFYYHMSKSTLLVGDRRNIKIIDLEDSKIYDHIPTLHNLQIVTYQGHTKEVMAGTDEGSIFCWRSTRAEITVGNNNNKSSNVDRPCITMHDKGTVTALNIATECTDAKQRLVSGGEDSVVVIWQKVSTDTHPSYRKQHVLQGHLYPIVNLFSVQNRLISTDLHTIKVWDLQSGECQFTKPVHADLGPLKKAIVTVASGLITCVAHNYVRIWLLGSNECVSEFSLDTGVNEIVYGAHLANCFLFVFSISDALTISIWNIVTKTLVKKWTRGRGKTAKVIVSSDGGETPGESYYFELCVSPPRPRYGKRKRSSFAGPH